MKCIPNGLNDITFIFGVVTNGEPLYVDDEGEKWFKYTCSYKYQDKQIVFHIWAISFKDADNRLIAIGSNACVDGQVIAEGNI